MISYRQADLLPKVTQDTFTYEISTHRMYAEEGEVRCAMVEANTKNVKGAVRAIVLKANELFHAAPHTEKFDASKPRHKAIWEIIREITFVGANVQNEFKGTYIDYSEAKPKTTDPPDFFSIYLHVRK